MSIEAWIVAIGGAAIGGATTAIAPDLFGAARTGIPRVLGIIKLTHLRTATGGACGLFAATAIALSTSDHSHKVVTYVVWYGLAAFALLWAISLTVIIDKGSERAPKPSAQPFPSRVTSGADQPAARRRLRPSTATAGHQRTAPQSPLECQQVAHPKSALGAQGLNPDLREWLIHERERGEEYIEMLNKAERRLAGEVPRFEWMFLSAWQPAQPRVTLRNVTQRASSWSTSIRRRLERDLPPETERFAGGPPAAHPNPTQGDFHRLAEYVDVRVEALKRILGEDDNL